MQPTKGVLIKRCFENMQQIYRRTPMPKCDYSTSIKTTTFVACLAVFNFGGKSGLGIQLCSLFVLNCSSKISRSIDSNNYSLFQLTP